MKIVIIESPYAGRIEFNTAYARECMKDSLKRGEAPFASHLLYTQVLNDGVLVEREQGISCGLEFYRAADLIAFYADLGFSRGMDEAFKRAELDKKEREVRYILGRK